MPSTVILSIKGEVRKVNVSSDLTMESLQKVFKKKDAPERVCYYEYDDKIIFIFGYKKGKKGTENKIELPDPHASTVLYGDALVIVSMNHKWETPIPFTVDQWNAFYNCEEKEKEDKEDKDDKDDKEEEEEIIYEDEVKDDFDVEIPDVEEEEEEVKPVRKKRAPVYNKVDTNIKEEISFDSEPETHILRMLCLNNMKFLEKDFSNDDIRLLEKSIYQTTFTYSQKNYIARSWKSPVFTDIYRQNVRSVFSNIHPESPVKNMRLLSRVIEGEFALSDIPSMSSYEMFPEKWFELKDKLLQREQKILEGNKSRATDQFKCRRCQKRECTYYELQTRSADEPMTIFITCLNCGKEWRQGG
jgi:DNA-directed RNA polymerase subunit M/transcription elongation factor TFIIS